MEKTSRERWKDIRGYEGHYIISEFGKIMCIKKGVERPLRSFLSTSGYMTVGLTLNNKQKKYMIHRLLAIHFIENALNKTFINHINGNPLDNRLNNLEWVSHLENMCHKFKNKNKSSKYIGVCFVKNRGKWLASIMVNKKLINIGKYNSEEEAHTARINYESNNNIVNKYS